VAVPRDPEHIDRRAAAVRAVQVVNSSIRRAVETLFGVLMV
jgi:hypothetical protein